MAAVPQEPAGPVVRHLNLSARRLGWTSVLLLGIGVWWMVAAPAAPRSWPGAPYLLSESTSLAAPYDGLQSYDAFGARQFTLGVTLAAVGALGLLLLAVFLAWRQERRVTTVGAAPSPVTKQEAPLPNPSMGTLSVLAGALGALGVVVLGLGLLYEGGSSQSYTVVGAPTWWDVSAPRFFTVGLLTATLGLLALYGRFFIGAWRDEVRRPAGSDA